MYFGNCDGVFYCLDKRTGAVRWRKEGLGRIDSAPALHDGTVLFAAIGDTVYALKSDSGEVRWKASFPGVGYRSRQTCEQDCLHHGRGTIAGLGPKQRESPSAICVLGGRKGFLVECQSTRRGCEHGYRIQQGYWQRISRLFR